MSLDKLDAAKKYYEGLAAEAEVTIDMYLNNSVGIGEQVDWIKIEKIKLNNEKVLGRPQRCIR